MNRHPIPGTDTDKAKKKANVKTDAEARLHRLSERVAQLEDENLRLEEVLGRNTRMFEALLSNGRAGVALTGPDRRIVRVIKGLTGIDPTLLAGRQIDSLTVPEDKQSIVDAYRLLLSGGCRRVDITVRVPGADGSISTFTATLTDMLDNPNVQGIVWNYAAVPA